MTSYHIFIYDLPFVADIRKSTPDDLRRPENFKGKKIWALSYDYLSNKPVFTIFLTSFSRSTYFYAIKTLYEFFDYFLKKYFGLNLRKSYRITLKTGFELLPDYFTILVSGKSETRISKGFNFRQFVALMWFRWIFLTLNYLKLNKPFQTRIQIGTLEINFILSLKISHYRKWGINFKCVS